MVEEFPGNNTFEKHPKEKKSGGEKHTDWKESRNKEGEGSSFVEILTFPTIIFADIFEQIFG